jgi:hypothetical protein
MTRAATPAACGVAMQVPLIHVRAISHLRALMLAPGAKTIGNAFEKEATPSLCSSPEICCRAPTEMNPPGSR